MTQKSNFNYILLSLLVLIFVSTYFHLFFLTFTSSILLVISYVLSRGYSQSESKKISNRVPHVPDENWIDDFGDYTFKTSKIKRKKGKRKQVNVNADGIFGGYNNLSIDSSIPVPRGIMFGNRSFTNSPSRRLNSTLPAAASSPMVTRLRNTRQTNGSTPNRSILSAAGPLLSSPFIPQIKRALGLEPVQQPKYSGSHRHNHSFVGIASVPAKTSPGILPHVRLGKPRRLSLNDRNTSMLNKSSTVKIAPPTPGRVASPSLYQMVGETSIVEEKNTPDTYAVVSALKERRKRSLNVPEETQEVPAQQAKRRRQESQQSNASTSSLPPMPDTLPDLSYTMRLETPGLKRPSRPSQDSPGDWETMASAKRPRGDSRNNAILSSLSSSRRFAEKQKQKSKRKADEDEKENESMNQSKMQKTDTVILPRENTDPSRQARQMNTPVSEQQREKKQKPQETEGKNDLSEKQPEKTEPSKPPLLKNISTKKSSIYTGLSRGASFKKVPYANVLATEEDYERDREVERNRVKQMLQDLDDSFAEKTAKKVPDKSDAKTDATAVSATKSTTSSASVTSATVSIAMTSTSISLPKLPSISDPSGSGLFSKGREIEAKQETSPNKATAQCVPQPTASSAGTSLGQAPGSTGTLTTTPTATGVKTQLIFTPLFQTPSGAVSAAAATSTGTADKPGGFNMSSGGTASTTPASAGAKAPGGFNFGGSTVAATAASDKPVSNLGFIFGTQQTSITSPVGQASSSISTQGSLPGQTATSAPSFSQSLFPAATAPPQGAPPPYPFGSAQTANLASAASTGPTPASASTAASVNFPAGGMSAAPVSTGAAGGNFSFTGTPAQPAAGGGFNFKPAATAVGGFNVATPASTSSAGFSFSAAATTASNTGTLNFGATQAVKTTTGFNFGASAPQANTPSSNVGFGFPGGQQSSASPAGLNFGTASTPSASFSQPISFSSAPASTPTPAAGAFSFGASTNNVKTTAGGGFSFSATPASTAAAAGGFSFNATASTAAPAGGTTPSFSFQPKTTPVASSAGGFNFGQKTAPAPAFGQSTGSGAATFQFGAATTQASASPAFGSQTASQPSANPFGTQPATGMPAFGSASQQPANQTPAFGAAPKSNTPVFGSSTNQPPAFGGTQKSNTPVFGSSTNQASAFGQTQNTAKPFGSAATTQAATPFAFGAQPTTTASGFGQTGTPSKPSGGVFSFGQTGNQQPAATPGNVPKGFDFSASAGGGGQFNFSANNSFGTPGTPNFNTGTPNVGFSVGTGSAPPSRPRVITKAKRRTAKK